MKKNGLKYWQSVPGIVIGAFIGLLALIAIRAEYYGVMEYQTNMHPTIAFYFSPVLLVIVLAFALPVELLFRRWHQPNSQLQACLIGAGYATLFVWWVFPAHWMLFLLLNPPIIRGLLSLILVSKGSH
jgi:hypothetical protein